MVACPGYRGRRGHRAPTRNEQTMLPELLRLRIVCNSFVGSPSERLARPLRRDHAQGEPAELRVTASYCCRFVGGGMNDEWQWVRL